MTLVGAYVCPRGVFLAEVSARRSDLQVLRTSDHPGALRDAREAARHLAAALATAGFASADVAVALRGFELAHHTLSFPPAPESALSLIVAREIRRLEPHMADPLVGWLPLPGEDAALPDQPAQRHFVAAAIPRGVATAFEDELRRAGYSLLHLTALPAAVQRLAEEFDANRGATSLLAPLPDGLFLGLFIAGGVRIAIEPPLHEQDAPDAVAMAEEAELGATYVRQQFRGTEIDRAVILGPADQWTETEAQLSQRLGLRVERLDLSGLPVPALAALGAVIDARSPAPLSLGGRVANRRRDQARAVRRQTSLAAVAAAAIVSGWAVFHAIDARQADRDLRRTRQQVEQISASLGPVRQTATQRRLVRDADSLLQVSVSDRAELQRSLAAISNGIAGPIRMDSLHLERGTGSWIAALAGSAVGATSGLAVQSLHDFYRDLPRRLVVEELSLDQMAYVDTTTTDGTGALVRFQVSFVIPERKN